MSKRRASMACYVRSCWIDEEEGVIERAARLPSDNADTPFRI